MKLMTSAFYQDTIKLDWVDIFKLVIGKTIEGRLGIGPRISLYHLPDNGCPCGACRKVQA